MKIKFLYKTGTSFSGSCPAMYDAEDGWVVQGKIVPGRRDVVWVQHDVIDRRGIDLAGLTAFERVEDGYLVHGTEVDAATLAQCRDLLDDETAVHVPARELALV